MKEDELVTLRHDLNVAHAAAATAITRRKEIARTAEKLSLELELTQKKINDTIMRENANSQPKSLVKATCQSRSVQTEPKLKHKSMQTLRVNQRAQMQQTSQVKFVDALPPQEQKAMQTDLIEE